MKWITRIAYGLGQMQKDLVASALSIFSIVYMENCLQIRSSHIGSLLLCGQIINAVCTPVIGILSDKAASNSHRSTSAETQDKADRSVLMKSAVFCRQYFNLRNRKAWHLYGSILMAVGLPALFGQAPEFLGLANWIKLMVIGVSLALLQCGWASVQIAHLTMINYLTTDPNERVLLVSLRYFFGSVADISSFVISYFLLRPESSKSADNMPNPSDEELYRNSTNMTEGSKFSIEDMPHFRNIALSMTAYSSLFVIIFQIIVPERIEQRSTPNQTSAEHPGNDEENTNCNTYILSKERINRLPTYVTEFDELHSIASQLNEVGTTQPNGVKRNLAGGHKEVDIVTPLKWYSWLAKLRFWIGCFIFCTIRTSVALGLGYLSPMLIETFKLDKTSIVLVPLGIYVTSMLTTLIQHTVAKRLGRMGNAFIGIFFILCFCMVIFFYQPITSPRPMIYGAAVLFGVGSCFCNVVAIVVVADMIGNTEVSTAAFVHGLASLTDKIFTGVCYQLIQLSVPTLSYQQVETYIVGCLVITGGLLYVFDYFYMRLKCRKKRTSPIENGLSIGNLSTPATQYTKL